MNILDPIIYQARIRPHAPALISPRVVVTYAQLVATVDSLASHVRAAGIGPGQVVTVSLPNGTLNVFAMLALARIGAISVGTLKQVPSGLLADYVRRLRCVAACHSKAGGAIEGLPSLVIEDTWFRTPARGVTLPSPGRSGSDVWRLLFSSGTTGRPKVVPWTHASTLARMLSHAHSWSTKASDRLLTTMIMSAGLPLAACLTQLSSGASIVFPESADATNIFEAVERFRVTHLVSSPFLFPQFLNAMPDGGPFLPSLRSIAVGGGRIPDNVRDEALTLLSGETISVYGATEVGMVAVADLRLLKRETDAVGRVLPTAEVEATDEGGRPLPQGEEGLLRVRTLSMSAAYVDDPDTTARVFRDGWFYPGDIGRVTADGLLRVTARSDEVINVGGIKFDPARIENALTGGEHVAEIAVAELIDAQGAASLGVAVVASGLVDRVTLTSRCRALVPASLPIQVVMVDTIPRSAMGKVLRAQLAEQINAALRPG